MASQAQGSCNTKFGARFGSVCFKPELARSGVTHTYHGIGRAEVEKLANANRAEDKEDVRKHDYTYRGPGLSWLWD